MHKNINQTRINKLYDMLMSIMFLYNDTYTRFINSNLGKVSKLLNSNSYIIQPYMKATTDKIDMCCIGGISLGQKFIDTNPLSRGYYFLVSTQGNSEEINEFYEFIKNIPPGDIYELLTNAINEKNAAYVKQLINSVFISMFENGKLPQRLSNFDINTETGTFTRITRNYYLELETSSGISIYKLLANYSFPSISANNEQTPTFYSREIGLNKQVSRPKENLIQFGKIDYACTTTDRGTEYILPYYDFATMMRSVNLSFIQPNGFKLIQIYTPNGELMKNNLFFIFSKVSMIEEDEKQQRFNVYDTLENNVQDIATGDAAGLFTTNISTSEASIKRIADQPDTPNATFKAHRMKLNGVDKKPLPIVKPYI